MGENFSLLLNAKCFYCGNKCEYKLLKLSMLQNRKKINLMPLDFYTRQRVHDTLTPLGDVFEGLAVSGYDVAVLLGAG